MDDMVRIQNQNKELCDRYPFLIPWNRFSGELCVDDPDFDWSFTELDDMPDGWRKALGIEMCEEIRNELIRTGDLYRWRIFQLKEKYASLRLYDNGHPKDSRIPDIISKYEQISERTCIVCGKPATRITTGWICPYCDDCCPKGQSESIDEYYGEDKENG